MLASARAVAYPAPADPSGEAGESPPVAVIDELLKSFGDTLAPEEIDTQMRAGPDTSEELLIGCLDGGGHAWHRISRAGEINAECVICELVYPDGELPAGQHLSECCENTVMRIAEGVER